MAITFQVGFQVSDRELKDSLKGIQTDIQNAFNIKGGMSTEIQNATKEAISLEKALKRATTDKGISYYSLQAELAKAGTSATQLVSTLTKGGESFKASLNAANTALATADRSVISLNSKIKEMARVTVQSFKFSAAQTMIQGVSNAVREAYQWVEELNSAITDIGVVTGKTAGELDLVTQSAIKGAKELRVAAADYAEGQLIFYQQGLNDQEVQRRTEITVKAAAAANQSMKEMSSQLTAIWNTYQMGADEQARAASVGAKMAAETAVDFADIATAMQTAAAPAAQMGVSYNSLAAIISTVGDTTQQSASVIGNAFKTIFSRFQQLKSEGTDGEVTLNRVSSQLQELGINVLDSAGELRQLDDVIHEVGEQWDGWSSKQQLAIAQLVGGTRQYGQFLALMQNYDKYQDLLQSANLEDGSALESQYEASLESIESYALNAGEAWNRAFGQALDPDMIKGFLSIVEDAGDVFGGIVEGVGGLKGGLMIVAGIFAKQIVPATGRALANIKVMATSLTTKGRQKNINNEYNALISQNKVQQRSATSQTELENAKLQGQKLENDRKIALINEDINTKLKTASGAYKIQLEYQQQQIKNEQQKLQLLGDQALEIQRQAEALERTQTQQAQRANSKIQGTSLDEIDSQISDANMDKMMAEADIEVYKQQLGKINSKMSSTSNPQKLNNLTRQRIETEEALTRALERQRAAEQELNNLKSKRESFVKNSEIAQVSKLNTSLTQLAQNVTKTSTEGKKLGETTKGAMISAVKEIKLLGSELSDVDKSELSSIIQKMQHWGDLSEETIIGMIQKVKQLATEIKGTDDAVGVLDAAVDNAETTGQSKKTVEKTGSETNPQGPAAGEVEDRAMQAKAAIGDLAQGVMQIGGAATMAYGACSMVMSVWTDESAGAVEKIMAIVSALTMIGPAISMGAQGFQVFGKGIVQAALSMGLFSSQAAAAGGTTAAAGVLAQTGWGPFLPLIIAITAAIAALVAIGAFLIGEFSNSTPQAQLDKTKEAAEGLATAAEEAKTAADDLRNSIEGYDSAVKTLNDCVVGTEEWEQALKAANEAAMTLIDNLPSNADLEGLYYRDQATGLIKFDQDKLDNVQQQADNNANKAEYAASVGQISVQQKTNEITQSDLASSLSAATNYTSNENGTYGTSSTQMENILKEHLGELAGTLDENEFKEKLKEFGADLNYTTADFEALRQQTIALAQSTENAAAKADLLAQMQVDEILGDDYSAEVKQIAGEQLAANTEDWEQKYLGALTNGKFGSKEMKNEYGDIYQAQSKISDKLLSEYNSLTGKNWQSSGNGVQGTDSNRIFEFINEEGEIVQLRAEQVAAEMAAAKALEEVTGSAEKAADALSKIDQNDEGDALKDFLTTGNFNSMTEEDLKENFALGEDNKVTTESAKEYLIKAFGSEEELKAAAEGMGKTVDEFVQEVADGATTSFTAIDNMGNNLVSRAKKIFDDANLEGVEVGAQQEYASMVEKVFTAGGKEGGEFLNGFISDIESAIPEGSDTTLTDVIEELGDVNWDDITPEQLAERMEEMGIPMDGLIDKMPELISLMQNAAAVDFSSAQDYYAQMQKLGQTEFGDTIEEEDYQKLTAEGKEYFQLMADGTYQMVGDAREFQNMMKNEAMSKYDQVAMNNQQRLDQIDYIQNNTDDFNYDNLTSNVHNEDLARTRMQYLEATGYGEKNQAQMQNWAAGLEDGTLTVDEYIAIRDAVKECGDYTEKWTEETKALNEEQQKIEDMQDATRIQGDVQESGLDYNDLAAYREGIEDTIDAQKDMEESEKDYTDALLENENMMNEVAKEQARFTQGLEKAGSSVEDWKDIWDDNGTIKDYQKFSDSLEDMRGAYSDLLDVDGSSLSEDFLSSAENMELLEKVLTGSAEEAADALAELQQNAIIDLDLNMDDSELLGNINTVQAALEGLAAGTEITPTVDNQAFFDALNAMIIACGDDMAKIEALCNNLNIEPLTSEDLIPNEIGVDVDSDTTTVESEGKNEATSYSVEEGPVKTFDVEMTDGPADIDVGSGKLATVSIPSWDYVPKKETEQNKQEIPVTSYSLKPGTGVTTTSSNKTRVNRSTPPSPSNYRGGSPKSGGGGKGGGGGSAPKHQAKKAAKYSPIKDRYATVKTSIDKVANSLDKLNDASDDAFGSAKIRNLQKINLELQKQGRELQKLRKLSQDYAKSDQKDAQLARLELFKNLSDEKLPGLNLDQVLFNSDDFVKNRTELTAQLDAYLESLYKPYYEAAKAYDKADSVDEKESERIDGLKERYETAKTFVEEFLAALDLVDESAEEAKQALLDQLENIRTWMANKIEEASYKMELQIDINETDISLLDHMIDKWGDLGVTTGKTWNWLNESMTKNMSSLNAVMANSKRMEEILTNIDPENPQFQAGFIEQFGEEAWDEYLHSNGALPQEVMDQMAQNADDMIKYLDAMYDNAEEMLSQYMTIFDSYIDRFDQISTKIQQQNDELDMYTQLLEVSGQKWGASGREARKNIADARVDNAAVEVDRASAQLKLAKQAAEETQGQLQDFYDQYGTDPQNYTTAEAFMYNKLKEASDSAQDALSDAQSGMTQAISDMADAAAQAIEEMAQVIKEETIENLGGDFADFSEMTNMYDQQYNLDHFFLEDYDKNYQLNKLLGEIDDSMADITDPERLKEYQSLIDDINAANQEGVDITQTDVDLLNARFEIQKAMDAYEEAVNAKNTMRLARDASGNWNYVYSTDESQTEDAAQKLADAQYNYEKLLHEARDESEQYWIQAQQEFFEWQEGIDQARLETDAKYREQIKQQYEYYQRMTELHTGQVNKYNEMLGAKFEETTLGIILNTNSLDEAQSQYTAQHEQYHDKLKENTQKYGDKVKEVCENAGIDYDNLANEVREKTEDMQDSNNALKENIQNLYSEGSQALSDMNARVSEWKTGFIRSMNEAEAAVASLIAKLQELRNAQLAEANHTGFDMGTDYTAKIHNYIGEQIQNGATAEDLENDETLKNMIIELKNKLTDQTLKDAGHTTVVDRWGQQGPNFVQNYLEEMIAEVFEQIENEEFKTWDEIDEWVQNNWDKINAARNGETYTGGLITTPQVRSLAEKGPELVLNTEDTKNILETVKTMRETIRMKMSNAIANIGKQTETPAEKAFGQQPVQTIDQNVSIDATFPNVSVASEIEEALNNLINQAVQYATRNNR